MLKMICENPGNLFKFTQKFMRNYALLRVNFWNN
jgi:hypothetical protein